MADALTTPSPVGNGPGLRMLEMVTVDGRVFSRLEFWGGHLYVYDMVHRLQLYYDCADITFAGNGVGYVDFYWNAATLERMELNRSVAGWTN